MVRYEHPMYLAITLPPMSICAGFSVRRLILPFFLPAIYWSSIIEHFRDISLFDIFSHTFGTNCLSPGISNAYTSFTQHPGKGLVATSTPSAMTWGSLFTSLPQWL